MNIFDINNTAVNVFGYALSYAELAGTTFGLLSVWLAAKENIHTWTTGFVNIIFFFAVFYQVHLYADMLLQVYFFITGIYGLVNWAREKQTSRPLTALNPKRRVWLFVTVVLATVLSGFAVQNIHLVFPRVFPQPAALPYIDSFIAVSSILATILLAKRITDNWVLWIMVDIAALIAYSIKGVLFIAIEYGVFLILAAYGLSHWMKIIKNERAGIR